MDLGARVSVTDTAKATKKLDRVVAAPHSLSLFSHTWECGHEPFKRVGADTFIIVSSSGNVLWTCDPHVIIQLSTRHLDFKKPVEMLGMLNIYGPTLTASEGHEHRTYRKIAAPSFSESTHGTIWKETLQQIEMMLANWDVQDGEVSDMSIDASKLALHVLSKALFDMEMKWNADDAVPPNHAMSYSEAISGVFKHNQELFMMPHNLLRHSPKTSHKHAIQSFDEFGKYMQEMISDTASSLQQSPLPSNRNLLENFVSAAQATDDTHITDTAVLGNLFIFILAGHETSANTLTFALSLLATRPTFQRELRKELDSVLGDLQAAQWTYPEHFSRLLSGRVGALLNETLRLYTVLPFIPKTKSKSQTLTVNGKQHIIAADTLAMINTSAVHRNPVYWARSEGDGDADVRSFRPERWLDGTQGTKPGSFIPFAEGSRSCMGARFAKVEFCAAISGILKGHRVELRDGSDGDGIARAEEQLATGVGFEMGLKLTKPLALRFVKRSF